MALPTSKQDFQYYFYVFSRVVITILLTFGLYEFVYLNYFLDTTLLEFAYLKYLYKVISQLKYNLITFWVSVVTLSTFLVLTMYFLLKNPHSLTLRFSRFALRTDVKKIKPSVLQNDGFCLGSFHSQMLRTNEPLGLLCVAPAGAGKTTGTVIPTIVSCDKDSLIINDPKGELYDETSKYRRKISNVFRIEWGQAFANRDENTTFWNPLDLSNLPQGTAERSKYVDMITNILIKMPKGDTFWANSGRKTLSAMILYSIYKEELENKSTNIATVKDILATIGVKDINDDEEGESEKEDASQQGFLIKARELDTLEFPESIKLRCKNVFSELSSTSPNTLGSILATISSDLSVFNSEYVRELTSSNTFSMENIRGIKEEVLVKGETTIIEKPTTIYLISPAAEQELFGVLSAIFVEVAYKYITSQDLAVVKKSNIVRFILDEVAFFPPISAVIDGPAIARGYRGSFLFVCQDLSQIQDKYSEGALNTMLTNTAFKIVLPQNNDKTAERLAKLAGQTQITEWQGVGKTRQRVKKIINLIEPTDVLSLPAGKQIVFVQNNAKTPIFCDIPFYFKNKEMLKKLK
jgi:type IV secretion system protein VirD4